MYRPFKFKRGDILEHSYRDVHWKVRVEYHMVVGCNYIKRRRAKNSKKMKKYDLVFIGHDDFLYPHHCDQHYLEHTYMHREKGSWRKVSRSQNA